MIVCIKRWCGDVLIGVSLCGGRVDDGSWRQAASNDVNNSSHVALQVLQNGVLMPSFSTALPYCWLTMIEGDHDSWHYLVHFLKVYLSENKK